MTNHLIKIAAALALFVCSSAAGNAQPGSGPGGSMMQGSPGAQEGARQGSEADDDWGPGRGMKGWYHGWRGDGDWGPRHARGHMGPGMMRLMIILMDTDGDGALSLEEVQAVHARIFTVIDADGDNRVTPEEMQAFFTSLRGLPSGPQQRGQGPAQRQ